MIHLIGTSHIAKESLELVKKTIKENNPDFVCVELDKKRYEILKGNIEENSIKDIDAPFFQKAFYWMLKKIQDNISRTTGIMPGQEMLDAVKYGKESGSNVALIDQKIEITFNRLNNAMLRKEKIKLFLYLILSTIALYLPFIPLSFMVESRTKKNIRFNLNEIPDEKIVEYSMNFLLNKFPTLYYILVEERNRYMAANIIKISQGSKNVVVVVGAGHIQGIKKILIKNLQDVKVHTRYDLEFNTKETIEEEKEPTDKVELSDTTKEKSKTSDKDEKKSLKKTDSSEQETKVDQEKEISDDIYKVKDKVEGNKSKDSKSSSKFSPKDFGIDLNRI
ncbi:MAG: TraB/GumN family protein [Candidatus Aenigmarchaeota archaeon]|nr:TraB/GumN family protein [Candidatus Aenigmarchaeota archaeon]